MKSHKKSESLSFYTALVLIVIIGILLYMVPFDKCINNFITPNIQKKIIMSHELYTIQDDGSSIKVPVDQISSSVNISVFSNALRYVLASCFTMLIGCFLFNILCKKNNFIIDAERIIFIISILTILFTIFVFFTQINTKTKYNLDKTKLINSERYVEIDERPKLYSYPTTTNDSKILKWIVRNLDKINFFTELSTFLLGTWLIPLTYYQNKHKKACNKKSVN